MLYQFQFHSYQRPFKCPLQTSHGTWKVREGILLQLIDQTEQVGRGEIAPLHWFGSESLEQALDFCRQLPHILTKETIFDIPLTLPACQFGFEMAWEAVVHGEHQRSGVRGQGSELTEQDSYCALRTPHSVLLQSALLPAGKVALSTWQKLWEEGYRTFKWKVGVEALEIELAVLARLAQDLPKTARLRLDANGGLSMKTAKAWLAACDLIPIIEYLEQPLPPSQFAQMMELSMWCSTPLALDESVATLAQLQDCHAQGWRGVLVIKPAIAGSPRRLRQFFQAHAIDAVFSSVFETEIGREAGLKLAAELGNSDRAMGYGTSHWFRE
ncbi:o-succinylbenzoate synthase [Phormidium sp. CLA17]|uniref:o-succinylbenzoate synthase n=1 Tax=Leptolyngbya sp. Cla-17 TaxID=2803751 RepID=UPI001490EAE4|nr:o-succinylbenzoate synthase [Leptolyngbya sp. Cla-17]MBM0743141.1 o-succinylbenzoate synthase [Leptolyngbya sp. Cla-17]